MIPITITYTPYAEGVKIIGVTGRAAEIRIPDHIDGLPVIARGSLETAVSAGHHPGNGCLCLWGLFCFGGHPPAGTSLSTA